MLNSRLSHEAASNLLLDKGAHPYVVHCSAVVDHLDGPAFPHVRQWCLLESANAASREDDEQRSGDGPGGPLLRAASSRGSSDAYST